MKNADFSEAFVYRNDKHSSEIHRIMKCIEEEYLRGDRFSQSLIKGYMQQLLSVVYRTENRYKSTRHQNKYVQKALSILEEDFTTEISLSVLADKFKISAEHFSRIFKKETGLGFNEYLSLLRL